jgi:hypothetical protein
MRPLLLGIALAMLLTTTAVAQAGGWQTFDNTSATVGSPSYAALLKADNTVSGSQDDPKTPTLALTCDNTGLALSFIWPDLVDRIADQAMASIRWKLDAGPIQQSDWSASVRSVSESGRLAIDWAEKWSAAKTLTVRIPDQHGGQEATFELAGLSDIVGRVAKMNCG